MDEPLMMVSGSTRSYFHANHLYSVAALTDGTGTPVERYRYDAYGKRTVLDGAGTTVRGVSSYGNQIGFQGRVHDDDSGLVYCRTRYLSPSLGRFLNRTPWGPLSLHLPPYPIPDGRYGQIIIDAIANIEGSYVQGRYSLYDFEKNAPSRYLESLSLIEEGGDETGASWNLYLAAAAEIGSDAWSNEKPSHGVPGGEGNRCSFFVYDMLVKAGGAVPPRIGGFQYNPLRALGFGYPPSASQWSDPSCFTYLYNVAERPLQAGDIVTDGTHMGIYDGMGGTISASSLTHTIVDNDWGFRHNAHGGQHPVFRVIRLTWVTCCGSKTCSNKDEIPGSWVP